LALNFLGDTLTLPLAIYLRQNPKQPEIRPVTPVTNSAEPAVTQDKVQNDSGPDTRSDRASREGSEKVMGHAVPSSPQAGKASQPVALEQSNSAAVSFDFWRLIT